MLNSATGLLSGTPNAAGNFTFTIRATDANNCTGARTYTLQIACPGITVNPALLPAGHLNLAYSAVPLSASGGTGPYSFAVTAGVLPAGLLLNGSPGRPHKPACSRSR